MEEKYDQALLGILQHEGKIEKFLNAILGFLYRRTDFYRIMKAKEDKLGFPPGVALKLLTSIFKQYDELTRHDDERRDEELASRKQVESRSHVEQTLASMEADKSLKEQNKEETARFNKSINDLADVEKFKAPGKLVKDSVGSTLNDKIEKVQQNKNEMESTVNVSQKPESQDKTSESTVEKDEDPELTRQQGFFQSNPDSYNGAVRDNYSWSQSITDIDLRVKVPMHICKGKDVNVVIGKKHVKVEHKDSSSGQWNILLDGALCWEVHKDESMWTLNPGENVHINFEKKEERWWEALFTDEPKISVRKIDASRPMSDLDDEAQAKIEEMMYNDRLKKMGQPTAQEQKMHDMLKNAWDAEGSPFKGQPFDPSKFSMDQSGVLNMKSS